MLSDDFSLASAAEDFFDVTHMIGIQDADRYTGAITVVSKFLNPNLKYYTPRVNHQVRTDLSYFAILLIIYA
jgi:hypothetical protein